MEDTQTVVDTSVDAGNVEIQETESTQSETQTVETTAVDAQDTQDPKVGEAIRKEVERREAKLKEKYEQENKAAAQAARDSYIAEQGYTWNGKPITTEAEYNEAVKERDLLEKYKSQNLPDEVVSELVENKKFREKYEANERTSSEKAKEEAEAKAFFEAYPDTKPQDIPQSVWDDVNKGSSLVDAYTRYENKTLREQLAAVQQQKQVEQQNNENAASSTGSMTGKTGEGPKHFTREQVEKMSREDVEKNYSAVMASMKKW